MKTNGLNLLLLLICSSVFPQPTINKGLMAWWPFDEETGAIIYDQSGNHLDGELFGAGRVAGICGKALFFNGRSYALAYYQPVADAFKDSISIALWVKKTAAGTGYQALAGREIGASYFEYFMPCFSDDRFCLIMATDGNHPDAAILVGEPVELNCWYHLAVTFDGWEARMYIDGDLKIMMRKKMDFAFVDQNPLIIGSNSNDQGKSYLNDPFTGLIDELMMFTRVLTEQEIKQLFLKNLDEWRAQ